MKSSIYLLTLLFLHAACAKKSTPQDSLQPSSSLEAKAAAAAIAAAPYHNSQVLFNGGNESIYHSFRIPSIVKTKNGTLIAFAEGRRWSPSDWGDINLVFKRSFDNGSTWTALGEVVGSGNGTWGNPTAVYDWNKGTNGRVWVFMSWNDGTKTAWSDIQAWGDRRVFSSYSDDHGATWSTPQDMSATLLPPNYKWDAMGPGIGIQTMQGSTAGRLIIPAYGRNIYSDNNGTTWQYQLIPGGTDEGTIVERMDGTLLRNDRPGTTEWNASKRRRKSVGSIPGTFGAWSIDNTLNDPKCEGSMIRYNTDAPDRIIFLNPNSTSQRCNMTVRISYDDGATWPISRAVFNWNTCDYAPITVAKGGYSSMIKTSDYAVAALIEINENVHASATSNKSIEFHKFNLPWILNGATEPQ
ncbi:sialidase family protein [Chitinophaga barathri]|uniref:exo-alpha-sialidase n=1 Tax=Chitinophaga barathri TaxID=1647451 RepID=A0A3N4MDR2_9BACT|nr:sialidase family protein [Chitinophaga barathri]RPD41718.1 exo-alpha-sialidase [Chitinophaga barathri]